MAKIAVLGTGPSITLYSEEAAEKYDLLIGVNDIWKFVHTDIIVCLDKPAVFYPDRIKIINESKPRYFYSQMVLWDTRPDFVKIDFQSGYPDRICDIDSRLLPKSFCSPFVACAVAYKYHDAKEIHLFGVDMTNHPNLNGQISIGIKKHFRNLKTSLAGKGCNLVIHGNGILSDI
jgi:hypothetical protein